MNVLHYASFFDCPSLVEALVEADKGLLYDTQRHTQTQTYEHMHAHACTHTQRHTQHVCIYILTHTDTHTHTCTYSLIRTCTHNSIALDRFTQCHK